MGGALNTFLARLFRVQNVPVAPCCRIFALLPPPIRPRKTKGERFFGRIRRASFDRGFHSPDNQEKLAKIIEHPCLPVCGVHQAAQQEKTASVEFREARQSHPGIESAIGALQSGNGLERCRDRTERGFARYSHYISIST